MQTTAATVLCGQWFMRSSNVIFSLFVAQAVLGCVCAFSLLYSTGLPLHNTTEESIRQKQANSLTYEVSKLTRTCQISKTVLQFRLFYGTPMNIMDTQLWMKLFAYLERIYLFKVNALRFARFDGHFIAFYNHTFEITFENRTNFYQLDMLDHNRKTENFSNDSSHWWSSSSSSWPSTSSSSWWTRQRLTHLYERPVLFATHSRPIFKEFQQRNQTTRPFWTKVFRTLYGFDAINFVIPIFSDDSSRNNNHTQHQMNTTTRRVYAHFNIPSRHRNSTIESSPEQFFGLFAIQFSLGALNQFLKQVSDESEYRFIMNSMGEILASSYDHASEIALFIIQNHLFRNTSVFSYQNKRIETRPLKDEYGLDWVIVVVFISKGYAAEIVNYSITTIVVFIILMTILFLGILIFLHVLENSIQQITDSMNELELLGGVEKIHNENCKITEINEMRISLNHLKRGLSAIQIYLPHIVVESCLRRNLKVFSYPVRKRREMTVMFCSIDNLLIVAEHTNIVTLLRVVSEFLEIAHKLVHLHFGTVDKIMDGTIMAFWNEESLPCESHEINACRAALECLESVQLLEQKWIQTGFPQLVFSAGINTGEMAFESMGSPKRIQVTVIGDSVNIASRLNALASHYQCSIFIGERTYKMARKEFVCLFVDFTHLKGKQQPLAVYHVRCFLKEATDLDLRFMNDTNSVQFYLIHQEYKRVEQLCRKMSMLDGTWPVTRILLNRYV
ncbi:hypothetical protein C9374_001738 [Naegleria lovaniensis]|uniref:Guanylate cyclase domain-containing protein n=1 Tax=Naegleria lovaniensis TaxID=51637 RepID=A0AA88GS62_NAELO|nr:uncharacterized protein C9374_001738 [Naegleria lovaniensis]KAG2387406.1 hypothetical protein C9374_001738 [Naegleria lovaniensis]